MAKYLMIWTLDKAHIPADPEERGKGWQLLMEMVKTDMQRGIIKDWGVFPSEGGGYSIMEGSNVEIMQSTEQYVPFVDFKPMPIATAEEALELISSLAG
jgi:hypothetical protein